MNEGEEEQEEQKEKGFKCDQPNAPQNFRSERQEGEFSIDAANSWPPTQHVFIPLEFISAGFYLFLFFWFHMMQGSLPRNRRFALTTCDFSDLTAAQELACLRFFFLFVGRR